MEMELSEAEKLDIERRDMIFFKRLKTMSDAELAERLERGGTLWAPNPHYVLEAARRLRKIAKRG